MSTALVPDDFTFTTDESMVGKFGFDDPVNPPSDLTVSRTPTLVKLDERNPLRLSSTISASGSPIRLRVIISSSFRVDDASRLRHGSYALGGAFFEKPPNQADIEKSIHESQDILNWEEDWDGEGSPRFKVLTWQRATEFVRLNSWQLWQNSSRAIPAPEFLPVVGGSIDIEWQVANRILIVTIPVDPKEPARFYGHDADSRNVIKGTLDTSANNEWLFMWALA